MIFVSFRKYAKNNKYDHSNKFNLVKMKLERKINNLITYLIKNNMIK